ncbi:MAG TPA: DUF4433 domain-containing protein [Terriglobia bacterium]|nr:DUF4433 domain-containing protein [Terriglobia bacterium]
MTSPPASPKIYHITHRRNFPSIIQDGGLLCDRDMILRQGPAMAIGIPNIKQRRVEELNVPCHPGTRVGDYVPFYLCPRSVMLFLIYKRNHPDLHFREGQNEIVHLEADLLSVVAWAQAQGRRWAFSLSNAGARYTQFRADVNSLDELDWTAIAATDFRDAQVKERKQAEFLVHERFPFELVERIGVESEAAQARVVAALAGAPHQPLVDVRRDWYF